MGELYIHDLNTYVSKYNLSTFIETGTGVGTGVSHACMSPFNKLFSIEIVPSLAQRAKLMFKGDSRVHIVESNSLDGLKVILSDLPKSEPILFWLDAHFPGADFGFNSYHYLSDDKNLHMPLVKEVELISSYREGCNDVYIIDDLSIYERGEYEMGNWNLYDTYGGGGIGFIEDAFLETHDLSKDFRHQGFIILTPKESNL